MVLETIQQWANKGTLTHLKIKLPYKFFDQWDPSTLTLMEEMGGLYGKLFWKINLIWSHSMRVSWSAYELCSWPLYTSFGYILWKYLGRHMKFLAHPCILQLVKFCESILEVMFPYRPLHMNVDDQLELIYNNSVWIQDVAWKTCQKRWMINLNNKRRLVNSVLAAWHDDNDNLCQPMNFLVDYCIPHLVTFYLSILVSLWNFC